MSPPRPATGSGQRKAASSSLVASQQPLQGKLRPHSAALLIGAPPPATATAAAAPESPTRGPTTAAGGNGERVGATSDELIRDLEHKVRKVVELKRAKSDKLRFAVAKKREEVEKAKLILQDLIKDSGALGLHYTGGGNQVEDAARGQAAKAVDAPDDKIVEEPNRLQPIASISRRPVYSKHTKINELETKLEKRAQASHEVMRSTMVLEHIKKRLLNERIEITQETNELKARFAELNHQTQELQKKEISASEAVNQIQTRLAQQKADMAANLRKYKREVEMRQKWAREKAKFEKYYNDQMQMLLDAQSAGAEAPNGAGDGKATSPNGRRISRSRSPNNTRRNSVMTLNSSDEMGAQEEYRQAFLRMGFGHYNEGVDPEEIIRTCISHEEIKKELDAKHDEDMERIAILRDQLAKSRDIATEKIPLSKRGTSQRLEVKEIEISSVERALATIVDQYMFVDQSVRPLKIGLQQILQNITNETVNVDDMTGIENALMGSIEEMMKLVRETQQDSDSPSNQPPTDEPQSPNDAAPVSTEGEPTSPSKAIVKLGVVSADNFTSPFNIRIPPKPKEPYYVLGVNTIQPAAKPPDDGKEPEDFDFDVMDRCTVKRISSVLVCTSTGKKSKDVEHDNNH
ncbi:Phosphatidylinositol 4-phosphate 5-kinase its3 [Phytophthora cinnamomi]|uniref:Phosphatidylinositol 4-phosphate 5-kinase its3 n=1 Tax=Phytophthora cinnamomi TaxID=4785 RepID=UPI00355A7356|nr:Phosphatidylinositol 4-phosphate 5-kinase its3 [Phytophthora cinnamomi]